MINFKFKKINKNSKKIPKAFQNSVVNDIINLKNTNSIESYEFKKKLILTKWKRKPYMKTFLSYFSKQWLDSAFCNWQLFQTPPGFSMSNCPIESYNTKIKKFFSNRTKYNLLPVFEIFEQVVKIESKTAMSQEIPLCAKAKVNIKIEAKKHLDSIKKLENEDECQKYLCNKNLTVLINPNCFCPECTNCTCSKFLDAAVCIHLIGCCFLDSIEYPGIKIKAQSKKNIEDQCYEMD